MNSIHCTLCVKKCLPKEEIISLGLDLNHNPHRVTKDEDALKNELQVIFLLRKILEIPQEICCKFLTKYGNPYSWIDFCDSCSILVKKCRHIFDEMTILQQQFKTIQNQIKNQMTDTQMEKNLDEGKRRIKEGILSYINPGISSVGNVVPKEEIVQYLSCSVEDTSEFKAINNPGNLSAKTELNESFAYPLNVIINEWDGFGHCPAENDPLGQLEDGDNGVSNRELEERQESEFVAVEQIKLEQEFLSETSDVNVTTILWDSNEQSEVAKSPTYIIPQIIKETNLNPKSKQDLNKGGFGCEICGKHFQANHNLKVHKRIHTGEKPYKCETCRKAFRNSNTLNEHQRRHTGKRPYKCSFCEKAFLTSTALAQHLSIHTGVKPYKCDICGKDFRRKSTLYEHKRRHNGEKRHKCEYCEKSYVASTDLRIHLFTHTGVKPCKCDICNATFSAPSSLRRHKALHNK